MSTAAASSTAASESTTNAALLSIAPAGQSRPLELTASVTLSGFWMTSGAIHGSVPRNESTPTAYNAGSQCWAFTKTSAVAGLVATDTSNHCATVLHAYSECISSRPATYKTLQATATAGAMQSLHAFVLTSHVCLLPPLCQPKVSHLHNRRAVLHTAAAHQRSAAPLLHGKRSTHGA
jgi:hypothetical protein